VKRLGDHYFTSNPTTKSDPRFFQFTLKGYDFTFITDRGVFSKNEVDFGTRQLVEAFALPNIEGPLLDVGCGYGPIGLSLAKAYGDRQVVMVDVNERALELVDANSKRNKIENVTVLKTNLFDGLKGQLFAAILSNPPIRAGKKVVHQLLIDAYDHLKENGELWIVIQKKQGAPSAIDKLESIFPSVEVVDRKKGYFIIRAKKY
jgi:16S rRNA (guanine1207-N2)-methyltransferase